jgi:hypothetical protein
LNISIVFHAELIGAINAIKIASIKRLGYLFGWNLTLILLISLSRIVVLFLGD